MIMMISSKDNEKVKYTKSLLKTKNRNKENEKVKKEQESLKNLLINQCKQGANKNRATIGK